VIQVRNLKKVFGPKVVVDEVSFYGLDKPEVLTIRTFDRFAYTLKIGKLSGDNYPLAVSVTADPVTQRTPSPDEKAEDKAKLDEEFKTHLKQLEEKAASEREFEKRIYLVPKFSVDPFLRDRADLLAHLLPHQRRERRDEPLRSRRKPAGSCRLLNHFATKRTCVATSRARPPEDDR
jgi:hypothetical protein